MTEVVRKYRLWNPFLGATDGSSNIRMYVPGHV